MPRQSPSTVMCLRFLLRVHEGHVDRHTCFDYYETHNGPRFGLSRVAQRGAGGRMARRLHQLGLADDGVINQRGRDAASGA